MDLRSTGIRNSFEEFRRKSRKLGLIPIITRPAQPQTVGAISFNSAGNRIACLSRVDRGERAWKVTAKIGLNPGAANSTCGLMGVIPRLQVGEQPSVEANSTQTASTARSSASQGFSGLGNPFAGFNCGSAAGGKCLPIADRRALRAAIVNCCDGWRKLVPRGRFRSARQFV